MKNARTTFRCVLHGSFQKNFPEIQRIHRLFTDAGIEVLAPKAAHITTVRDGFGILETDDVQDPRTIELLYLHHLKQLGRNGFSYFVNPEGYIGKSASYELGIAQVSNIPCFFLEEPHDHPVYLHANSIWKPELLIEWLLEKETLPQPRIHPNEKIIHRLWEKLILPGSVVAVGGIVEFQSHQAKKEKEILLVKTHKWGGRYSIVGGRVRRGERLHEALLREIQEETGLRAIQKEQICTFDQIENSGYYQQSMHHIFVDTVAQVHSRQVQLNDEAQEYIWMPALSALKELNIEPNARKTIELYAKKNALASF